jgi:hypothetical protein
MWEAAVALSDACFAYLDAVRAAAAELAAEVHHYSAPEQPLRYGSEIDGLRRACAEVADAPYDPEAGARLLRLASSVMSFHDTPPAEPESERRKSEMRRLVRLLERELDGPEVQAVTSVVENVVAETPYTSAATTRLIAMLKRLGASSYDVAVKIVADVGSATAKKLLGL